MVVRKRLSFELSDEKKLESTGFTHTEGYGHNRKRFELSDEKKLEFTGFTHRVRVRVIRKKSFELSDEKKLEFGFTHICLWSTKAL